MLRCVQSYLYNTIWAEWLIVWAHNAVMTHINFLHFHLRTAFPHNTYFFLCAENRSSYSKLFKQASLRLLCLSHWHDLIHSFPNLMHVWTYVLLYPLSAHTYKHGVMHICANAFTFTAVFKVVFGGKYILGSVSCQVLKSPVEVHVMPASKESTHGLGVVENKEKGVCFCNLFSFTQHHIPTLPQR